MLKTIRWFIFGAFVAVLAMLFSLLFLFRPFHPHNTEIACKLLGPLERWLFGLQVARRGYEQFNSPSPKVIIANHQDSLDLLTVGLHAPKRTLFIGKKSLAYIPFFGLVYWLMGHIFINRKHQPSALASMHKAQIRMITENYGIFLMPEGTRSRGKGLGPFKKGAFHLAIAAQVEIVPMLISSYSEHTNLNHLQSGKIIIEVLPPIPTTGRTLEEVDALTQEIHDLFTSNLARLNRELAV